MLKKLTLICSAFLVLFWGASAFAEVERVKVVEEKEVVAYIKGSADRASYLKTIKTKFEAKIGVVRKGFFCVKSGNMIWDKKNSNLAQSDFSKIYKRELGKANYPTPGPSDTIFEESGPQDKKPELHVGILVKQVNANICYDADWAKGGVYLKVFWQVYAPEIQKVVFETTTEGSYQSGEKQKRWIDIFSKAFEVATRNFLADPGFSRVVSSNSFSDKIKKAELLKIKSVYQNNNHSKMDITAIRSAVVTIVNDRGTGSGFFINKDGYILTNYHVVGESKFVKVKLATGRELVGEVIRSDKNRDVALVKTEPIAITPIALRKGDLNIGEDVYAIGSPLGHTFNTTLTKGILSGYRDIGEKKFLQSDVAIQPGNSGGPLLDSEGNSIGITVLRIKGFSGMNFFIPISDALSKLGVEVE